VITIGIDPHKRTHTAVAASGVGQLLDEVTIAADETGQRELLDWAHGLNGSEEIRFALEDCRHVNGRLERFLLAAGEHVLRVPPKLMAGARKSARTRGKSDAIDALAIARAALREESDLHLASLDEAARELKLLVDHRDALVRERTVLASRLRWQLHDLEPGLEPVARSLDQASTRRGLSQRLARREQSVQVRICRDLLGQIGDLTRRERQLASEIGERVRDYAPELLEVPGVGRLSAGKLIGEIAGRALQVRCSIGPFRGLRADPGFLGYYPTLALRSPRQPPAEHRLLPDRLDPGPHASWRPCLPDQEARRRQVGRRSPPLPQAPFGPRRLDDTSCFR